MSDQTSDTDLIARLDSLLAGDDADRAALYPALSALPERQPVHTVYVPADRFSDATVADWRRDALGTWDEFGPLPGVDDDVAARVRAKLGDEPIEDLRIDFEDGYGIRSDADEDAAVASAVEAISALTQAGDRPSFIGIRMKSLEPATRARAVRTAARFVEALGTLPPGFRITLPKVTSVAQVDAMNLICAELESRYSVGPIRYELQVETPQAVMGADGRALIAPMLHAAGSRCVGLHYGTYDYSAALGISAAQQSLAHPAADYAKAVMQVAVAGTGAVVSDGSTNILPVGDRAAVQSAWALHRSLVTRALERGYYQGWDLHPAQLPTRFAATFAFYRSGIDAAAARLSAYQSRSASGILDEPATARALVGYLLRAEQCGAVTAAELESRTGLTPTALHRIVRPEYPPQ